MTACRNRLLCVHPQHELSPDIIPNEHHHVFFHFECGFGKLKNGGRNAPTSKRGRVFAEPRAALIQLWSLRRDTETSGGGPRKEKQNVETSVTLQTRPTPPRIPHIRRWD